MARNSAVALEQKDEGGGTNPADASDNENKEEEDGDEEEVTDEVEYHSGSVMLMNI